MTQEKDYLDLADRVEAAIPVRVQLSRKKGWRMPANTVSVARPGQWGNPYPVSDSVTREQAVTAFRALTGELSSLWHEDAREKLGGKNLACWCPPGEPCHADVLLELVNTPAHASRVGDRRVGE